VLGNELTDCPSEENILTTKFFFYRRNPRLSISNNIQCMLFMESVVFFNNHKDHINTSCGQISDFYLTFCAPCIMIYLLNKDEEDAPFSLKLFHVSTRLTIYHQKAVYCICSV